MKKSLVLLFTFLPAALFAQQPQKYALVMGNGAYAHVAKLNNPVNDAGDIADALEGFGFTVDRVLNGSLDQMEAAVMRLKNRLSVSKNSYGFLFYAGHGVQLNGENYLLPVDANIPGENFLRQRAVSVQTVLDELNGAENALNMVVLDACRDNPFGWTRSGSRGLAVIGRQPADSIVVYATSAGSAAADGQGRNGLFTAHLLNNMKTPGIDVNELFRLTMGDVALASGNKQRPAVYNQFPGVAYLGAPAAAGDPVVAEAKTPVTQAQKPAPLPAKPPAARPPATVPQNPNVKKPQPDTSARLHTVGVSAGSAFSAPWFIGTVRGTYSPFNYSFAELGMDMGLGNNAVDAGYFSLCPYLHYNFFMPFRFSGTKSKGGWYAGLGAAYTFSRYTFDDKSHEHEYLSGGSAAFNIFTADITAGVNLFDMVDISYTLRSNFKSLGNKLSVGYTKRFR